MVAQNAAVSLACCLSALIRPLPKSPLFTYARVCVPDHTWTTLFLLPYGFSLVQMYSGKHFPAWIWNCGTIYQKSAAHPSFNGVKFLRKRKCARKNIWPLHVCIWGEGSVCSHTAVLCSFPCLKYNSTITLRARSAFLIYCSSSSASPSSTPACHKAAIIGRYSWPS